VASSQSEPPPTEPYINNETEPESDPGDVSLYRFWQPRFWPIWAGIFIMRILVLLPYRVQMTLGRALGRLLARAVPKRRRIAAVNLRICFPDLDEKELQQLLKEHFESLGMSIFELALAWWISDKKARALISIDGLENVTKRLQAGQGVVLLSGHFPAGELTGRVLNMSFHGYALYRPMENPLVDQLVRRSRRRSIARLIPKDDMRQMIRALKKGKLVWYAPDQSYARKYSELVPFFGEPAMTNAALTHIARISNACVILYVPYRLKNDAGYYAEIKPPLEDFPTDDAAADAMRVNNLLEEQIRFAPEQYYWIHRRFKNRPAPHADPYVESADRPSD
jgi:KDO2-lipid IV(A) lauroyltransferase